MLDIRCWLWIEMFPLKILGLMIWYFSHSPKNPVGRKTFCIKILYDKCNKEEKKKNNIGTNHHRLRLLSCCCCCWLVWRMTWHDEDNRLESGFCLLDTSIKIKVTNFGECVAKQHKSNVMTLTKFVLTSTNAPNKTKHKLLNLMELNPKPNHNFLIAIAMPFAGRMKFGRAG